VSALRISMTKPGCLSFLITLILTLSSTAYSFAPEPRSIAKASINRKLKFPCRQSLPPTIGIASAFEIGAKLDATESVTDSGQFTGLNEKGSAQWRAVVLGICVLWSTNFVVVKEIFNAVPSIDPSLYAAIRFSLAAIVMIPRLLGNVNNKELVVSSMTIGLSVFFGYLGQAVGLMTTTANRSSFICSLNVVFVALLSSFLKKKFLIQTWISSILAVLGVAVLESDGNAPPVVGDLWSLCQPLGFGVGYVFLEYLVAKFPDNPGAITAYKILSIALASIIWALVSGHTMADVAPILESKEAVSGLLYTGTTLLFFIAIHMYLGCHNH
jgi:drug/metabolite transporter (DMT)-like permease